MARPTLSTLIAAVALFAAGSSFGEVNLTVQQVGSDVVVSGGGSLDLSGWSLASEDFMADAFLSDESLIVGAAAAADLYVSPTGFVGPPLLAGTGSPVPDSGSGAIFGIDSSGSMIVPANYAGGALGTSSATFSNRQVASLGLTSGNLNWTWDVGGSSTDSFNIAFDNGATESSFTYQIRPDPGLSGGYGFSGTVTTDGSLGDFQQGDSHPIIDWNITLNTPGSGDGVTEQTLTPVNSFLSLGSNGAGAVRFTSTQIILPDTGPASSSLAFSSQQQIFLGGESLYVYSAQDGEGGGLIVRDISESLALAFYRTANPGDYVFATVVPEPSSLALLGLGGLLVARRRRRQSRRTTL